MAWLTEVGDPIKVLGNPHEKWQVNVEVYGEIANSYFRFKSANTRKYPVKERGATRLGIQLHIYLCTYSYNYLLYSFTVKIPHFIDLATHTSDKNSHAYTHLYTRKQTLEPIHSYRTDT